MGTASLRCTGNYTPYQSNIGLVFNRATDDASGTWYGAGESGGSSIPITNGRYVVLEGDLVMSGSEELTSLSVTIPFCVWEDSGSTGAYATIYAYLYDSDNGATTLPSGAIGSVVKNNVWVNRSASGYTNLTFTFNNLFVASGTQHFYIWLRSDSSISASPPACFFADKSTAYTDTCSGTFQTRSPSMNLQPSRVATGSGTPVTMYFSNPPQGGMTMRFKYGSTELYNTTTGSLSSVAVYPQKSWFRTAGVNTLKEITVSVTADGYPTVAGSFTLAAGDDMIPTIDTPTVSIVQPTNVASTFPNTWIANVSKAKVAAAVMRGSYAEIQSVTLNYGSKSEAMTYDSVSGKYEATTGNPITGDTTFTIIVTDERGMTSRATCSVTGVKPYAKPSIVIDRNATYRCNSSGTETSGGPYVRVKATASYETGISGNTLQSFYFYVQEDGSSTTHNLTSGVQSSAYQLGSPRENQAITVVVVAQDKISDAVTTKITLPGAHKDVMVARRNSSGKAQTMIGIGMASGVKTRDGIGGNYEYLNNVNLASPGAYMLNGNDITGFIKAGEGMNELGKDMLAIDSTDFYGVKNQANRIVINGSTEIASWSNLPSAVTSASYFYAFRFVVLNGVWISVVLIERTPVDGRIWVNSGGISNHNPFSVAWGGWKGHTPDIR